MATTRTSEDTRKTPRKSAKPDMDAVQLLKADHRQVEEWFEEFEKSRSDDKKEKLAHKVCTALTVHTLLNLRATFTTPDDTWAFSVYGTNVTDSKYRNQVLPGTFAIQQTYGEPAAGSADVASMVVAPER